jgi:hypothetical protein
MSWEGPYKIGDYLATVARSPWQRPPEAAGVYVISEKPWQSLPTKAARILYVGQAAYLRYQIGRLLCDLLGFTGDNSSAEEAYQHKGGHSLWSHYCLPQQIEPVRLYLGWCTECLCLTCAEIALLEMMVTGPHRVPICPLHRPPMNLRQNCEGEILNSRNSAGPDHH